MSLVHNEQTKLTATFFNGIALAVFAVGGLAPIFTSRGTTGDVPLITLAISGICFVTALSLHLLARLVLRRLVP